MSKYSNVELVRRFLELGSDDLTELDKLVAPDVKIIGLWYNPQLLPGVVAEHDSLTQMKQGHVVMDKFFSNPQYEYLQILEAGDWVIVADKTSAKFLGEKDVTRYEINLFRVQDGRIAEILTQWDRLGFFQQVGVVPSQAELGQKMGELLSKTEQ